MDKQFLLWAIKIFCAGYVVGAVVLYLMLKEMSHRYWKGTVITVPVPWKFFKCKHMLNSKGNFMIIPRVCDGHGMQHCGKSCELMALAAAKEEVEAQREYDD